MDTMICKCVIEYDGTGFAGWQVQSDERTVQGSVEEAIRRILGVPIRVVAAGRTDAGVHALGQVASFPVPRETVLPRFLRSLNAVLPPDVAVRSAEEAPPGFNARFDAQSRTYRYTITTRRTAIGRNYAWPIRYRLAPELLEKATAPLDGAVNLKGFSKKNEDEDYETIIFGNRWTFEENLIVFEITAVRFFQHAVRGIVGSAVEVARGKESPDLLARILETGDRTLAGPTAPACGLCLVGVDYGGETEPGAVD